MRQSTVTNGFRHTHEDRPFAPPHQSPLDQASQQVFGCSSREVAERADKTRATALGVLDELLLIIDAEIKKRSGETDDDIVKYGFAQALVYMGAFAAYHCLTNGRDRKKSDTFGRDASIGIFDAALIAASIDG